jgi:hypothetical protein
VTDGTGSDDESTYGEPDEFDPLEDIGPDVPEVEIPEPRDTTEVDVPAEVAGTFWRLVFLVDVAGITLSLGLLFIYFRGEWGRGLALVALGVASLGYGYLLYRRYRRDESPAQADQNG